MFYQIFCSAYFFSMCSLLIFNVTYTFDLFLPPIILTSILEETQLFSVEFFVHFVRLFVFCALGLAGEAQSTQVLRSGETYSVYRNRKQ